MAGSSDSVAIPSSRACSTFPGVWIDAQVGETITKIMPAVDCTKAGNLVVDLYDALTYTTNGPFQYLIGIVGGPGQATGGTWRQYTRPDPIGAAGGAGGVQPYTFVNEVMVDSTDPVTMGVTAYYAGPGNDYIGYTDPATRGVEKMITFTGGNGTTYWDKTTGVGSQTFAGRRIGRVYVLIDFNTHGGTTYLDAQLDPGDGNLYDSDSGRAQIVSHSGNNRYAFEYWCNPATKLPWTLDQVAALGSGTAGSYGLKVKTNAGADPLDCGISVGSVGLWIELEPDQRIATGSGPMLVGSQWVELPLVAKNDGATPYSWGKSASGFYVALFHTTNDGGVAQLRRMRTAGIRPDTAAQQATIALGLDSWRSASVNTRCGTPFHGTTAGTPCSGNPGTVVADPLAMPSVVLELSGGTASADSQPYVQAVLQPVASGNPAHQLFAMPGGTFGQYQALLKAGEVGAPPTAALTLAFQTSGGGAIGSVAVAPSDVPNDGGFHLVSIHGQGSTSGGRLNASTTSTVPWVVLRYDCAPGGVGSALVTKAAGASYGGTAQHSFHDGVEDANSDIAFSIGVIPAQPTNLTAVSAVATPAWSGPGAALTYTYAQLAWAWGGSGFNHYELQRLDQFPPQRFAIWDTIARITNQAAPNFNDVEVARNRTAQYRVRVVTATGNYSDWTTPAVTVVCAAPECDLIFCSNQNPTLTLLLQDTTPRVWTPPQVGRGKIVNILGRNDPVAFWPRETGGERFSRHLTMAFNNPYISFTAVGITAVKPDRQVFIPATKLFLARDLPYVAVIDAYADRWYATAEIANMSREEPLGNYTIDVDFVNVADHPTPYVGTAPPVP